MLVRWERSGSKPGMTSRVGLILIAAGIISTLIGTYLTYSSLNDYTRFLLTPGTIDPFAAETKYIQFLDWQQYGGSATLFGLLLSIIGAVFYLSPKLGKTGLVNRDVVSDVPKASHEENS